jgi:apolipoprotein D and lipocalin family protein
MARGVTIAIGRGLRLLVGIAALALGVAGAGCGSNAPLDVAPGVDLSRVSGKWYEIARLPRTTQTDCHGTTAFYTQNADGTMTFVNQCNVGGPTGPLDTVTMSAMVPDPSVPAKMALDVAGFTGDYWILEVGTNYEYAVVGHPSRQYLWVLSRTPTLDADVLGGVVSRAQANHFDTAQLQYTPQPPGSERESAAGPVGNVPPPATTGCSTSGGRASDGAFVLAAVAVAAGIASRRRTRRA